MWKPMNEVKQGDKFENEVMGRRVDFSKHLRIKGGREREGLEFHNQN